MRARTAYRVPCARPEQLVVQNVPAVRRFSRRKRRYRVSAPTSVAERAQVVRAPTVPTGLPVPVYGPVTVSVAGVNRIVPRLDVTGRASVHALHATSMFL